MVPYRENTHDVTVGKSAVTQTSKMGKRSCVIDHTHKFSKNSERSFHRLIKATEWKSNFITQC